LSARLKRLDVETVRDLLYLFPRRHEDYSTAVKIADLTPGEECTVVATVWEAREVAKGPKGGRKDTEAVLSDDTGNLRAIWFGQRYLARTLKPGSRVAISGKATVFKGQLVFENPEHEMLDSAGSGVHTGRLVPVYPLTEGLTRRNMRRLTWQAVQNWLGGLAEALPDGATLVAGNSMSVRDIDSFLPSTSRALRIVGTRGASGIDGVASTAVGAAAVAEGPVALVVGDLSFLHDLNGLWPIARYDLSLTVLLVNNDGGGIFHMLPIREYEPDFTAYFATPHGLDFAHAAALHNLPYRVVGTRASLRTALLDAFASEGSQIIEVRSERAENQRHHEAVYQAAASAVGKILAEEETS